MKSPGRAVSWLDLSLYVGWHETWLRDPRALALVRQIHVFFPNETEALAMTGERDPENALARFRDAGARGVVLKLAVARSRPALERPRLAYHAAPRERSRPNRPLPPLRRRILSHYWLRGAPAEMCLRAANVCGGLSTEAHGGLAGFPTATRLKEILELPRERSV